MLESSELTQADNGMIKQSANSDDEMRTSVSGVNFPRVAMKKKKKFLCDFSSAFRVDFAASPDPCEQIEEKKHVDFSPFPLCCVIRASTFSPQAAAAKEEKSIKMLLLKMLCSTDTHSHTHPRTRASFAANIETRFDPFTAVCGHFCYFSQPNQGGPSSSSSERVFIIAKRVFFPLTRVGPVH